MSEVPPSWLRFVEACERIGPKAVAEFERVWPTAKPDLFEPTLHEVLTGLLGFEVYMLAVVSADMNLWHPTLGGMAMRSMTEALMNMRWIAAGGPARARRFQEYSLGRRKLLGLHIERLIDEGALKGDWQKHADELRAVVDSGRWGELLDIELGSWNDQTIRQTAIDTDMKFEYDLIYTPASAATHVEWSHLQETVLERCREVLHRGHWIPRRVGDRAAHPVFASQAAQLTGKAFRLWAESLGGHRADLDPELAEVDASGEALAKEFFGWPAAPRREGTT